MPGIIDTYTPAEQVCSARCTLTVPRYDETGAKVEIEIPLLLDLPVFFPSGGGFSMTFPLVEGDEVLVVFASRCIDRWWKYGSVQPQNEFRMHDLSDGFAFAGFRSQPRVLDPVPSTTSMQLRSDDGATKLDVADGVITVTAGDVKLGNGGTLRKLITDSFITLFNAHTHTSAASGSPTSAPIVQATAAEATTIVRAE